MSSAVNLTRPDAGPLRAAVASHAAQLHTESRDYCPPLVTLTTIGLLKEDSAALERCILDWLQGRVSVDFQSVAAMVSTSSEAHHDSKPSTTR